MSGTTLRATRSSYAQRRARAVVLFGEQPHAEQMLDFYLALIEAQERVHEEAVRRGWAGALEAGSKTANGAESGPALPMFRDPRAPCASYADGDGLPWPSEGARYPIQRLLSSLDRLLRDLRPVATNVLAAAAAALHRSSPAVRAALLETFPGGEAWDRVVGSVGVEPEHLAFYAGAFWQPIAEAMVGDTVCTREGGASTRCPFCGWPPQVAAIRDGPEVRGQRHLVCALCASWWPFPRSTCPCCLEADAGALVYHSSESLPHVRVEECRNCGTYLKSVDLRVLGTARPVVEDIATPHLDLWSRERALRKVQVNVLGL